MNELQNNKIREFLAQALMIINRQKRLNLNLDSEKEEAIIYLKRVANIDLNKITYEDLLWNKNVPLENISWDCFTTFKQIWGGKMNLESKEPKKNYYYNNWIIQCLSEYEINNPRHNKAIAYLDSQMDGEDIFSMEEDEIYNLDLPAAVMKPFLEIWKGESIELPKIEQKTIALEELKYFIEELIQIAERIEKLQDEEIRDMLKQYFIEAFLSATQ